MLFIFKSFDCTSSFSSMLTDCFLNMIADFGGLLWASIGQSICDAWHFCSDC